MRNILVVAGDYAEFRTWCKQFGFQVIGGQHVGTLHNNQARYVFNEDAIAAVLPANTGIVRFGTWWKSSPLRHSAKLKRLESTCQPVTLKRVPVFKEGRIN